MAARAWRSRARLVLGDSKASLEELQVLWHDMPKGRGGQSGAQIAFSPDGQSLFLTIGYRQRMTPAQDPNTEVGKILRLTLDGRPAPGNPTAGKIFARKGPTLTTPDQ
jgi:aldose sugar dehydrogenase